MVVVLVVLVVFLVVLVVVLCAGGPVPLFGKLLYTQVAQ